MGFLSKPKMPDPPAPPPPPMQEAPTLYPDESQRKARRAAGASQGGTILTRTGGLGPSTTGGRSLTGA